MDDPEDTMKDTIIKDNWSLTDTGLKEDDITFTRARWRAEGGGTFETPRIEFSHVRGTRHQEIGHYYHYFVIVRILRWSKGTGDDDIDDAKSDKWKMMEEIKRIVDLYDQDGSKDLPSDWKDMIITDYTNLDAEELSRPLLGEEFIIRVKIWWKPT